MALRRILINPRFQRRIAKTKGSHWEALLAEYSEMRQEIRQYTSQIFTVFYTLIGASLVIDGWMFTDMKELWFLPLFAIGLLSICFFVILQLKRVAHRIAYFQRHHIETKISGIRWATVFFRIQDEKKKEGKRFRTGSEWMAILLIVLQLINLILSTLIFWSCGTSCAVDWIVLRFQICPWQGALMISFGGLIFITIEVLVMRCLLNFGKIEEEIKNHLPTV